MSKETENDQDMNAINDSPVSSGSATSMTPVKRRRSGSVQSLVSRAGSFVSFDEEGDHIESQIKESLKVQSDLKALEEKVEQIASQGKCFQLDASILVKQVSDSLKILDESRVKNEGVATVQQNQMETLLTQTKSLITQCKNTSDEVKNQQWTLNTEFVKLGEWRDKVEKELLASRGNQVGIDEKVNHVHDKSVSSVGMLREESHINLGAIREELSELRKYNLNRSVHGVNQPLLGGVKTESPGEWDQNQNVSGAQQTLSAPSCENRKNGAQSESHAPTQHEQHAPTHFEAKSESPGENYAPGNYFGQFAYPPQMNHFGQQNPQWLIPNGMIDACPSFTANLYQNWCREVKLWRQAQVGANATQMIAKIVATLPTNSRMEVLAYLENTESAPHTRSVEKVMEILNHRFGRTDTERAWSWLTSFTEFKRDGTENYKDFWTRFTRCVTRLQAHGLAMSESVVFHRAIQALRVPEGQLPILLATLETFPNPTSVDSLKSLTIKMYETHRGKN